MYSRSHSAVYLFSIKKNIKEVASKLCLECHWFDEFSTWMIDCAQLSVNLGPFSSVEVESQACIAYFLLCFWGFKFLRSKPCLTKKGVGYLAWIDRENNWPFLHLNWKGTSKVFSSIFPPEVVSPGSYQIISAATLAKQIELINFK